MFAAQGDRRLEGAARLYAAYIYVELDDRARAEAELRTALATAQRPMMPQILATLARVALLDGRPDESVALARDAMAALEEVGVIEEGEALVRLMFAEALAATGDRDGARAAAHVARDRLLARAARITDPAWRDSFLYRVADHARTLDLAASLS